VNVTVVEHPLTRHFLSVLRDRNTSPDGFRAAARRLTYTLILEATAGVPTTAYELETPLEPARGHRMTDVVAVAVLRAGLGLLDAVVDLLPDVQVGFAGVQRNEDTAEPMEYYAKLPDVSKAAVLVLEPMLATGGSLSWAVGKVKDSGATNVTAMCVVVAPQGAARMEAEHPDVRIVTASLDRDLNDRWYIQPGLGDMGDRLFGTL